MKFWMIAWYVYVLAALLVTFMIWLIEYDAYRYWGRPMSKFYKIALVGVLWPVNLVSNLFSIIVSSFKMWWANR